jgi:hypothetical protein
VIVKHNSECTQECRKAGGSNHEYPTPVGFAEPFGKLRDNGEHPGERQNVDGE